MHIATLFPPATLSTISAPIAGTVDVLAPVMLDQDGGTQWSNDQTWAYSDSSDPRVPFANIFDKVVHGGAMLQPIASADALNYSYDLDVSLPRYKCSLRRPLAEAAIWTNGIVTNFARTEVQSVYSVVSSSGEVWPPPSIMSLVTTNDTFGLNCTAVAEHCNEQIAYIGVGNGFANWTYDATQISYGGNSANMSIAAYDLLLSEVFVTDCQLYNSTFTLEVAISNQKAALQVRSVEDHDVLDDAFWSSKTRRVGQDGYSTSSLQAKKYWRNFIFAVALGYEARSGGWSRTVAGSSTTLTSWTDVVQNTVMNRTREYGNMGSRSLTSTRSFLSDADVDTAPSIGDIVEHLSTNFSLSLMSEESLWQVKQFFYEVSRTNTL